VVFLSEERDRNFVLKCWCAKVWFGLLMSKQ
jgi:hypothetical protein